MALGKDEAINPDELDRADMLRLAAGDNDALNALMERHAPKLFSYLYLSLQNQEDAGDVAQETFARVYQKRNAFNPQLNFSHWLYAIASNLVRDQFRYRSRHPGVSLEAAEEAAATDLRETLSEDSPTPSESLQAAEAADAVRKALAALPEELRTPLILSEYEGLSHSEIGAILRCSAKAVETRLYRARKQLRSHLSKFLAT